MEELADLQARLATEDPLGVLNRLPRVGTAPHDWERFIGALRINGEVVGQMRMCVCVGGSHLRSGRIGVSVGFSAMICCMLYVVGAHSLTQSLTHSQYYSFIMILIFLIR